MAALGSQHCEPQGVSRSLECGTPVYEEADALVGGGSGGGCDDGRSAAPATSAAGDAEEPRRRPPHLRAAATLAGLAVFLFGAGAAVAVSRSAAKEASAGGSSSPAPGAVRGVVQKGLVKHRHHGLCMDSPELGAVGGSVHMWQCNTKLDAQNWIYNRTTGQIRSLSGGACLEAADPARKGSALTLRPCDGARWGQHWEVDGLSGMIRNWFGFCLDTSAPATNGGELHIWACNVKNPHQAWNVDQVTETEAPPSRTLRHWRTGRCLRRVADGGDGSEVEAQPCDAGGGHDDDDWRYDPAGGHLKTGGLCLVAAEGPAASLSPLQLVRCASSAEAARAAEGGAPKRLGNRWLLDEASGLLRSLLGGPSGSCLALRAGLGRPELRPCDDADVEQRWDLSAGDDEASRWSYPSLFCFSFAAGNQELQLLRAQAARAAGIFGCDAFAAFGEASADLGHLPAAGGAAGHGRAVSATALPNATSASGCSSVDVSAMPACRATKLEGVWRAVEKDGRFKKHDWVVQLDPATAFLPGRLRWRLKTSGSAAARSHFVETAGSCRSSGNDDAALQVLSRPAFEALLKGAETCRKRLHLELPGKERYLEGCLDSLKVSRLDELSGILSDNRGERGLCPVAPCYDSSKVAFSSFASPQDLVTCLREAQECSISKDGEVIRCSGSASTRTSS